MIYSSNPIRKKIRAFESIIICLPLCLLPVFAQTAGLQVSPEKLEFVFATGSTRSQTLIVVNPTADVLLFEVYTDDENPNIKINPKSFTLEAGARKIVTITADAKGFRDGVTIATLSVLSSPLAEAKISVNTGAKIPLTIKVGSADRENHPPSLWLTAGFALGALMLGLWKNFWQNCRQQTFS